MIQSTSIHKRAVAILEDQPQQERYQHLHPSSARQGSPAFHDTPSTKTTERFNLST